MANMASTTESKSKPSYHEYMKGGGCKEAYTDFVYHVREAEENNKEDNANKVIESASKLQECMKAHSDYYQPYIAVLESYGERVKKEFEANIMAKVEDWDQAESDDEKGKLIHKFMEGGDCKETWMAALNCFEKNEKYGDCDQFILEITSCTEAHSDYYPPWKEAYMAAQKTVDEQELKEVQDIFYFPE